MPALERTGRPPTQPERLFERPVNPIQRIHLELLQLASFDGFDGDQVVNDLISHWDLWPGAVMHHGYAAYGECDEVIHLTKLCDIKKGNWNVDTLLVLMSGKDGGELMRLAGGLERS